VPCRVKATSWGTQRAALYHWRWVTTPFIVRSCRTFHRGATSRAGQQGHFNAVHASHKDAGDSSSCREHHGRTRTCASTLKATKIIQRMAFLRHSLKIRHKIHGCTNLHYNTTFTSVPHFVSNGALLVGTLPEGLSFSLSLAVVSPVVPPVRLAGRYDAAVEIAPLARPLACSR